jgi:hypothetical protein
MKVVPISPSDERPKEVEMVADLFTVGLVRYHLRSNRDLFQ